MSYEEAIKQLPTLDFSKKHYTFHEPEIKNGIVYLGGYTFSPELEDWITKFYELQLIDRVYIVHSEIIMDRKYDINKKDFLYDKLTLPETLTILTKIIRSDRFMDGTIAKSLDNGMFEKLCNRLKQF